MLWKKNMFYNYFFNLLRLYLHFYMTAICMPLAFHQKDLGYFWWLTTLRLLFLSYRGAVKPFSCQRLPYCLRYWVLQRRSEEVPNQAIMTAVIGSDFSSDRWFRLYSINIRRSDVTLQCDIRNKNIVPLICSYLL